MFNDRIYFYSAGVVQCVLSKVLHSCKNNILSNMHMVWKVLKSAVCFIIDNGPVKNRFDARHGHVK